MKTWVILGSLFSSLAFASNASTDSSNILKDMSAVLGKKGSLVMPPSGVKYSANELSVGVEYVELNVSGDVAAQAAALAQKELNDFLQESHALNPVWNSHVSVTTGAEAQSSFLKHLVSLQAKEKLASLIEKLPSHSQFYRYSQYNAESEIIGSEVILVVSEAGVLIVRISYVQA